MIAPKMRRSADATENSYPPSNAVSYWESWSKSGCAVMNGRRTVARDLAEKRDKRLLRSGDGFGDAVDSLLFGVAAGIAAVDENRERHHAAAVCIHVSGE